MCFVYNILLFFFFFQAEDGIRDDLVTGVQTCALPIWKGRASLLFLWLVATTTPGPPANSSDLLPAVPARSIAVRLASLLRPFQPPPGNNRHASPVATLAPRAQPTVPARIRAASPAS